MKTKIIGMLAIIIAISASAFTAPTKTNKTTEYYWFLISDGISLSSAVPAADASFVGESTTAPSEAGCSGSTNQCLSGFTSTQVINGDQLKDDLQHPPMKPDAQN